MKEFTNKETMEYGGFVGSAKVSIPDNCLHGKLLGIDDLITYEAKTIKGLRVAFVKACHDYVETKRQLSGTTPLSDVNSVSKSINNE